MTETEINQAVAEALGRWLNFYRDLNACAEMEEVLDSDPDETAGGMKYRYAGFLYHLTVPKDRQPCRATAPQRCEAFLKTIGKWKE